MHEVQPKILNNPMPTWEWMVWPKTGFLNNSQLNNDYAAYELDINLFQTVLMFFWLSVQK
jgi:hypothetical protein